MLINLNEMCKELSVSKSTLRRWEKEGKIKSIRTSGGHRRYQLDVVNPNNNLVIAYARVSTKSQQNDLKTQINLLELYCASKGYNFKVISDIGSGLNYKKKGLLEIINLIHNKEISRIIIIHKDRLLRFGSEILFNFCKLNNISVEIINNSNETINHEQELVNDVLEIITVFSSRLYGKRSNKNKNIVENTKKLFNN